MSYWTDEGRMSLSEQERDALADAMVDYTKTRTTAAPERFERYIIPTVEAIVARHVNEALEQAAQRVEASVEILSCRSAAHLVRKGIGGES